MDKELYFRSGTRIALGVRPKLPELQKPPQD
jgi:hypothetical protein